MKKLIFIFCFVPVFAFAQKRTHTVAPKESFSSIGRLYSINGRELANFNKLDYDKGLAIGQVLKLPANAKIPATTKEVKEAEAVKPATTKPVAASNTAGTPIYHTVAKKETLYHISTLYGKVPIADIKKWNHLTSDGVNEGTKLIVGYNKGGSTPAANQEIKEVVLTEVPAKVKEVPQEPKQEPVEKPVVEQPKVKETVPLKQAPVVRGNINFNGGYFKNEFRTANNEEDNGTAVVFKSNSGWEDGKYYCLHNEAPENSIVKITNAAGKSIYAKVLDVIPDIKQNSGAMILVSNAAAAELGMGENKFECTITYSK